MKKFVAFGVAFLSLSLSLSQIARAENVDARSVALGGTTLGTANGAFAPLRNPAAMVDLGWGSFILPLSPTINIGTNTNTFNAFIPGSNTNYLNNLLDGFTKNSNINLEVQSVLPIFGFSGSPFPNFKIMNNPIAFGFNLWGKALAYARTDMSPGLSNALLNSTTLFNSFNEIQAKSGDISKQFNSLSGTTFPDLSKFSNIDPTNKSQVNSLVDEAETFQKNTLQPIISSSDSAVATFDKVNTQLNDILTSMDALSKDKQSGKGNIAADGHAVIAISGASRVFKNEMVDLSVGLNLKGFFFPANPSLSSIIPAQATSGNPLGALLGSQSTAKLFPLTVSTDLQLGPFKSINDIKNVLDTQLTPVVQEAKDIIVTAKALDQQLTTTLPKARENTFAVITDIPGIQSNVTKLQSQSNSLNQKISGTSSNQLTSTIMTSLVNDLKDVKFNVNQITEAAPMGVGVDLGFQARIMEDIVLGLVLENPLVLWPAKLTTNEVSFNSDATANTSTFDPTKLFKMSQGAIKDTNYNLTEPMALRFGGSYNLVKLTPYLSNALVLADVEQVFNGRPFAVHLGVEKGWYFGPAGIFARLGGQIGGLGNLVTIGLGFKGGPFNIDLGYGASNPFNPMGSNSATGALSTSLNF